MLKRQPKSTKFQKSKILVLAKFTRPNDQLRVGTKFFFSLAFMEQILKRRLTSNLGEGKHQKVQSK